MKYKLKFLSIFIFTFMLFSCSSISSPTDSSIDPTNPSVEPSVEPSTEPSVEPSVEVKDEFKLKKIDVEYLSWAEYFRGESDYDNFPRYISETYSVDNVLITEFRADNILDYTIEFEGCYPVEEIEITTNQDEFTWIYDVENYDYTSFGRKGRFPVKSVNNTFKFAHSNRKDLLPQYWHSFTGFLLDLTITKVKYNNQRIEVTENNRFISLCHPDDYIGYDVIKNTYNEVIIDFSRYDYKDYVWLDKGLQQGDSYIFYEECIVTLSFKYDIFNNKKPVEVIREIEIKFLEFDFYDNKPCFEMITYNESTFLTINVSVKATYSTRLLKFLVDSEMIEFYYSNHFYRARLYSVCDEEYLLNKEFESFIYVGEDFQIDLTEIIKNHI